MQALIESFILPANGSFHIRKSKLPFHDAYLHTHEDFEITLVEGCSGRRFIGNDISAFEGPDLVMIGGNLPHSWQKSEVTDAIKEGIYIVHLRPDFLGKEFLSRPETDKINKMIDKARRGICFSRRTIRRVHTKMKLLNEMKDGFDKLLSFLEILHMLSEDKDMHILSSPGFAQHLGVEESEKINRIYHLVLSQFQRKLSIEEAADLVNLTPSAFCRYFKKKTGKTFVGLVKEVRIGHATRLLLDSNKSISEICYECGYNNLSTFNKQFREVMGRNPNTHRSMFKG